MASGSVARQLGTLFECGSAAGLSDRQLIERFNARRDADAASEAAFAAMVARHGPMVLGVCRQLVADRQLAEDAFQAVFLVLARKARSIRDPDLLGNWLYGVALRTARCARLRLARLRQSEETGTMTHSASGVSIEPSVPPAEEAVMAREEAEALHLEIERLPDSFRLPVVLCYFEGLTIQEAARRLRWPHGTVRSRIARARDKLRRGLIRRGIVLPAVALAAVLDSRPVGASVSSPLCDITARAAIRFAAGPAAGEALTASTTALAREVLRTMLWHKLKATALPLLLLASLATGAGYLNAFARSREGEPLGEPFARMARTEPRPRDEPHPATRRMSVSGRVVDHDGKPLPNTRIAVLADRKKQVGDIKGRHRNILMGTAAADAEGRFALEFPAIPAPRLDRLRLIAAAPGRGLGMAELKTDAAKQEASIALGPETPVEGRLVDVQGQPTAGVVIRLAGLNFRPELEPYDAKGAPSLWPPPATTDANGRFRLLGLGPDAPATFEVADPRFARHAFSLKKRSDRTSEAEVVFQPNGTVALGPAQALDFHVVHADDARPVAGAKIDIQSTASQRYVYMGAIADARTDGQGRARVVPWPGDVFVIGIYPPEGEPYLPDSLPVNWPKAAVQHPVEVKLVRGVLVRGRLIEDPSGAPVAGGWVVYHQRRRGFGSGRLPSVEAVSGPDCTFTMVVPYGLGHLLVQGPTADYLHVPTSNVEMGVSARPSFHLYPDAHAVLDIKDGEAPRPIDLRLRRGVTVAGRVVAPNGRPVAQAFAFGRSYVPYRDGPYPMTGFTGRTPPQVEVKGGRFEIPGCDPNKPVTFYFLDRKDRLGATVEISGKSAAGGPVTVRLRPTASVRFLLKRADGKVPEFGAAYNQLAGLRLIITPGPDWEEINKNIDVIPGDFAYQINFDFDPNNLPKPGPDGRITLRNLIPGATYRFRGREFTPEPGQTVDLGEIEVDRPRR